MEVSRVSLVVVPESLDSSLRNVGVGKAMTKVVEECEFVFRQDVVVRIGLEASPNLSQRTFETARDSWIDDALAIACDFQCPLDGKVPVNFVAPHF